MHPGIVGPHGGARPPLPWPAMTPDGLAGLAGHSDLPPPPPGMTTHERLTQLLETEMQHGHLLQAPPPAPPPAQRVRPARLLSHRLAHHTNTTFTPTATRWSAHSARSSVGWARCRVRDADFKATRGRPMEAGIMMGPILHATCACEACPLNSQWPLRPWPMVDGPCIRAAYCTGDAERLCCMIHYTTMSLCWSSLHNHLE